jgi:hypothetical protein
VTGALHSTLYNIIIIYGVFFIIVCDGFLTLPFDIVFDILYYISYLYNIVFQTIMNIYEMILELYVNILKV